MAKDGTYLPVGLRSLKVYDRPRPGIGLWSHALLRSGVDSHADTLEGDVFLLNEHGQVVLEALSLHLQRLERDTQRATQQSLSDWLYAIEWQPKTRPQPDQALDPLPPDQRGSWLILTDSGGIGKALATLLEARGERCVLASPDEAYKRTYKRVNREHFRIHPARPGDLQ